MRGSNHIIAGLAMLGIGRAVVVIGENADRSREIPLIDTEAIEDSYGVIDSVTSWVFDGLDALGGSIASWSTWIHSLFVSDDERWYISVAIGLPLFIVGTVLADADLPHSLAGRFMPWGTMWQRKSASRSAATSPIAHRGWTHTLWVLLGVGVLTAMASPIFMWLLAGMVTHVLLDAMSMAGWVWYYPLVPSTWEIIERGDTRIVVSTRSRSVMGDRLRYHAGVPWLEHVYVAVLVAGGVVATWYTW